MLFYPDGAMRHTTKSNMLNEIEIKKYSLPSLMGNPDLGVTATDFMAILQSLITASSKDFLMQLMKFLQKILPSFLECEVLVAVPDRYKNSHRRCFVKKLFLKMLQIS